MKEINKQFVPGMYVPDMGQRNLERRESSKAAVERRKAESEACRNIPTTALEAGVVEKMAELVRLANAGYNNEADQVDLEVVLEKKVKEIIKLLEETK